VRAAVRALACAWLACAMTASAGPRLFGEDRLQHLFASFFVASVGASVARSAGLDAERAAWVGAGAGVASGLGKEWLDARRGAGADALDIAWTVVGAGTGLILLAETR
jgi:uncharacterized protein YfiM (DUF2279 family)